MWLWFVLVGLILLAVVVSTGSPDDTARKATQKGVHTLDVSNTCASNETVRIIAENPEIRDLNLSYNANITEVWPLKQCSKLRSLDIQYTGVEWCPATLVHCSELRWLNVSGTKVHRKTLDDIRRACPGIHIICKDCINLTV